MFSFNNHVNSILSIVLKKKRIQLLRLAKYLVKLKLFHNKYFKNYVNVQ